MTTDEKAVFIQIQNSVVSLKALVLTNCLNTFVHDCCSEQLDLDQNYYFKTLKLSRRLILNFNVKLS